MSFLDDLRAAREAPSSAWLQFTLAYKADRPAYYLFIEGRLDITFYSSAMRSVFGAEYEFETFNCGGKPGVIQVREKVRQRPHHSRLRCLFFVDKDLSDFLGEPDFTDPNSFSTDTYSIENYFVNEEALGIIWNEIWGLAYQDTRWEHAKKGFLAALRRFHREITPMMAWIVLARRAGQNLYLDNIRLQRLIRMSDDLTPRQKSQSMKEVQSSSRCTFSPPLLSLLHQARELKRHDPKSFVRGKFELWFFSKFITALQEEIQQSTRKPSGAIHPTSNGLAIALCGKLSIPRKLREFLELSR